MGHVLRKNSHTRRLIDSSQARVQEFVRGGGPKSESLFFFFFLLFNFSGGGGSAQKIDEEIIFSTKKLAKYR